MFHTEAKSPISKCSETCFTTSHTYLHIVCLQWLRLAIPLMLLISVMHFFGSSNQSFGQEQTPLVGLRPQIPADFFSPAKGAARTLERLQRDFDIYSWETFVAINWPSRSDGTVDLDGAIGKHESGDHPTFWENWAQVQLAFPAGEPAPWEQVSNPEKRLDNGWVDLLPIDRAKGKSVDPATIVHNADGTPSNLTVAEVFKSGKYRFINKIGKMHAWFADEQAFDSGPLVDSNGRYVRFEIILNEQAYEFIRNNRLYTIGGQQDYADKHNQHITFPTGSFKLNGNEPALDPAFNGNRPISLSNKVGAIIIKAAWKELSGPEYTSGRFHTREMIVYTPEDSKNNSKEPLYTLVNLGLVGIHIVHKSADVSQWNWSTFEHVDNCPDVDEVLRLADPNFLFSKSFSFFNSTAFRERPFDEAMRSINRPPERPWNPVSTEPASRRTQVVRLTPLTDTTRALNKDFQDMFRAINPKSVWQYYQLISTQWPTRPAGLLKSNAERDEGDVLKLKPADVLGGAAPSFLANSVLETYIQGQVPNTSSSCMECHANAVSKSGHFSDFTFILERARK